MADTFSALKPEHKLFKALKEQDPVWWQNLVRDKLTYVEVRKNNYLDIYYNGGRLLELTYTNDFKGKIHFEYIPLKSHTHYINLSSQDGSLRLDQDDLKIIEIDNFSPLSLKLIQKRIAGFYPPSSEKAIQASFILNNGYFIDSEFQVENKIRFDLVWVDISRKKLFVVELKKIDDQRLYFNVKSRGKTKITNQLKEYSNTILQCHDKLIPYYNNVLRIKRDLHLLSPELTSLSSLLDFTFESQPILLIGDCTQEWIDQNKKRLNTALQDLAYGCFYQGVNTRNFIIPEKCKGNRFIFA